MKIISEISKDKPYFLNDDFTVSPTNYEISTEDLVLNYTASKTVTGAIAMLGEWIYPDSFTNNTITFANSKFKNGINTITVIDVNYSDGSYGRFTMPITVNKVTSALPPAPPPPPPEIPEELPPPEPPVINPVAKIELYNKDCSEKLGELTNCIECLVEEERNGIFELKLIYSTKDSLFNSLVKENIIIANANEELKAQKFRIYNISKEINNKVTVLANHITYDLANDFIESVEFENQSCEYALNSIFRASNFSKGYRGKSDIINAQDFKIEMTNCLSAIAGTRGSVVDTFGTGAEILRNNEEISVLNKRGHDNGVTIEYAKNLTGFNCTEDTSELVTKIFPYAKYTDSETNKELLVKGIYVDSPFINNFSHPYIKAIDFSDKFGDSEKPTIEKLRTLAEKYFKEKKCDIPKMNFKIEFIPLSKCTGYEELQDKISLCDTVTIKHKIYNIDTKAKVIKTVFNVLKDRYEKMELGEPRTRLGDVIAGQDGQDGQNGQNGQDGQDGAPGVPGIPGKPGEDGKTYYTWIRYADDQYGNGMSNFPKGKEYIGIAYNKETQVESDNPKDYTWSKYVGDQGIPGAPGEDGTTLYTWIKYADDVQGNGMADSPVGKEYLGLAYNKTEQQESTNPLDYTWTKIKGDQGIPGQPGTDGKTYYTWVKYADNDRGDGMSDDPAGKSYLGLAFNKEERQESNNPKDYTWSKIKGEDGNIGDFPDSLPGTPVLSSKVYGFANIELSWTFENKVYYSYELYASKQRDFTPNTFDLIFEGQASTFLFQAKPNETWYFKVCAINTHGNRTPFSQQVEVNTVKIDDLSNYVEKAAIGDALIDTLNLGRGWFGELRGNYIDAKQLSVTDGNGKRTLDIDSFGNVNLDVTTLKIASKDVATREENETYTDTQIELVNNEIALKASKTELDNLDKRVEDAEIKLTPNKIINTVNEQLKAGGAIKGVATIIDKDKFLVKDSSGGSVAMDNGTIVMKNGNEKKMIALEERQLKLYNREGTNREEGNISSILSKDGTGGIGVYARNHTGSKVDLGIDNYDGSITLFFRGVKGRIDLWQRTVANKEIYCHEDIYGRNFIKTVATIPAGLEKYAINTNEGTGIDLYECILELKSEITKLKEEIKMLKNK